MTRLRHYTLAFLRSGDRLLLLNRLKDPGMGRWNGVGGKVQPDESPAVAAQRELLEETGIADAASRGAMPNLRYFLPPMLAGAPPAEHHCTLTVGRMLTFTTRPLRIDQAAAD